MRIPTPLRNLAAVLLLMLAVLLGTASLLGSAATTMIDTPAPLQRILGPLATDPELRRVLPAELGTALGTRIAEGTAVPQPLAGRLQNAISAAGGALLDGPGFPAAWGTTIESARADFTERLAAASGDEQVTLRLDLSPLLGSGYDTLRASLDGSALGSLLPTTLSMPPAVLETGWPAARQIPTQTLNAALGLARGWGWLLAGAVVAAAAGVLLATRAGRPWAVFAAGSAALALGGAARLWFGDLGASIAGAPAAPSVESLVTGRVLAELEAEVGALAAILGGGGIVLMIAGIGWASFSARRNRAPRRR